MKRFLFLGLAVLTLTACAGTPKEVVLAEADQGKTVEASQGQLIAVQLAANATTGYQWTVAENSDDKVLKLVKQEYEAPAPGNPPRVGQGGQTILHFRAAAAGTATVKLVYRQPWQGGGLGQEYTFTVQVK